MTPDRGAGFQHRHYRSKALGGENAAARGEHRQRRLQHAEASILLDEDHRITSFDEAAEKMFGYSKAEVIAEAFDLLIPERFRATYRQQAERMMAGSNTARDLGARGVTLVGLRKEGEEFPVAAIVSKLDDGGKRRLTATLCDTTEEKRREEQQRFLAEVGVALVSTLDYEKTLTGIAELAVRELAHLCLVEVVEESLKASRMVVHRDPSKAVVAEALRQIPIDRRHPRLGSSVFETKEPILMSEVTPEYLQSIAQGEDRNVVIRSSKEGPPILVKHVAEVQIGAALRYGVVTLNGERETVSGLVMMLAFAADRRFCC